MRVLLVEDDNATARAIELMLGAEGFNVMWTEFGEEGLDLAKRDDFDIILLDLGLPDISGLEVLRRLRAAKVGQPVLILTGTDRIETKVQAFVAGADDYMTKPFHRDELVARARAVVRRSKGLAHSIIEIGTLTVNLDSKTAEVAGRRVALTAREYGCLELLALRQGIALTKDQFMNHLYGGMSEPEVKIVDVFMCKVRKKLHAAGADCKIETIWGRGYMLRAPEPQEIAA